MRAVIATKRGGPDVLCAVDIDDPVPGPNEVLVRVAAAGVNFIDTYRRGGQVPSAFPHVPGMEGAGKVVGVGRGVEGISVGDRVAWAHAPCSYAERVVAPATQVLPVSADMDLDTAAALPHQGMTAHYLVTSAFPVGPEHTVLLSAAAGGVGLLATQIATARGARVIGMVSSEEKERQARSAGCAEVIRYSELDNLVEQVPALVREITGGRGVDVVFDGVGKDTFDASLASLRVRGTLVLFGTASGDVRPFDLKRLISSGSLFITRPTLKDYLAGPGEKRRRFQELSTAVTSGRLTVHIGARFALDEAARAHRALESRRTTGKVLLVP